jgi:hypothetical protein
VSRRRPRRRGTLQVSGPWFDRASPSSPTPREIVTGELPGDIRSDDDRLAVLAGSGAEPAGLLELVVLKAHRRDLGVDQLLKRGEIL